MKCIYIFSLFFVFSLLSSVTSFAGTEHDHHPIVKVSPEFESMKSLVGTWVGKTKMGGKEQDMKLIYELSSNDTVLIEKMNPGTKMAMTTMYANRGKTVYATHYCSLGNQPQFKLMKAKGNNFVFEMDGTNGITDKNEMYMHGVVLTLDGNKLKQEWTNYKDNKKGEVHTFEFTKL